MNFRDNRATSILIALAAEYIAREAGRSTLITPMRAQFGTDKKHVTIFVSVFPTEEGEHAISFLSRHTDDFREFLKKKGRFAILPFVKFEIDRGELHRQHIDEISRDL